MRTLPFFLDTYPRSRRPEYAVYRGESQTQVAIVGGGLTGCACAAVFSTAGVKAVLLEADRIGVGSAASSSGLLRHEYDASFRDTAARHGLRTARSAWQAIRRAALDFAAGTRRLEIRCDLAAQPLMFFTRDGSDAARSLRQECQARRDAGLDASWITARALLKDTGVEGDGAIRSDADAFDPYRAVVGLADAAARRGAQLFERTAVRRVRAGRKSVEVSTDKGTIAADTVIVTAGLSIVDFRSLRRHFAARQRYAVVTEPMPAAVRREVGSRLTALRDTASPPHQLRWLKGDRVWFGGAAQPPVASRAREGALLPRASQLMYELSTIYPAISGLQPEWAWDAIDTVSSDALPVIGPHRNYPRHLFALGGAEHGAGVAWLAARALLRAYKGEPAKGDEALGFARLLS